MEESNITRVWYSTNSLEDLPRGKKISQVYVRILDKDNNVIIVSKNWAEWQMPWWKPEMNENIFETWIREVEEETNIVLKEHTAKINLFGFYEISENASLDSIL